MHAFFRSSFSRSFVPRAFASLCGRRLVVATALAVVCQVAAPARAQVFGEGLLKGVDPNDLSSLLNWTDEQGRYLQDLKNGALAITPQTAVYPQLGQATPGAPIVAAFRVMQLADVSDNVPGSPLTQENFNQMAANVQGSLYEFYADGTFARVPVGQRAAMQYGDEFPVTRGRYQVQGNQVSLSAGSSTNNAGGIVQRGMEGMLTLDTDGSAIGTVRESLYYGFDDQVVNDRNRTYTLVMQPESGAQSGVPAGGGRTIQQPPQYPPQYQPQYQTAQPTEQMMAGGAGLLGHWSATTQSRDGSLTVSLSFYPDGQVRLTYDGYRGHEEHSGYYSVANGQLQIVEDRGTAMAQVQVSGNQLQVTDASGTVVYQRLSY